jgi:Glycosyltransferase
LFVPFLPGRKKIIVYWHSDIVKQRFLKNIFRPAINALLKKATKIIVTSEKYALGSPFLSKNMHKCISVPCAANLSKYGIIVPNNSKKTNFEQIRYLFVGRHIPYKGISLLVDAFNMIEDNKVLHIVGDGVLTKELMAMAKNKNIVFTGELTNEKLLDEYLQADVLVLPSITRNEAFGVVIVEAFAFGLPVICFNIINSGVSWVNQDRETGIVVKNIDAKSLKKAILDIADDETKFEKYKINAIKRYAREFSLPVFQERIRRLVDEQL